MLLQVGNLRLTRDIRAAGEQFFCEFQLLAVLRFQRVELQDNVDFVLFYGGQALSVGGVTHRHILQQRLLFHRQGRELRLHPGQRFRHGVKTHANTRRGGVQQVHRLVRQLTAGEVTPGESDGSLHRLIRNVHPVVMRIAGF